MANILNESSDRQAETALSITIPPTLEETIWWTLVHQQKSYRRSFWPTKKQHCACRVR